MTQIPLGRGSRSKGKRAGERSSSQIHLSSTFIGGTAKLAERLFLGPAAHTRCEGGAVGVLVPRTWVQRPLCLLTRVSRRPGTRQEDTDDEWGECRICRRLFREKKRVDFDSATVTRQRARRTIQAKRRAKWL